MAVPVRSQYVEKGLQIAASLKAIQPVVGRLRVG